MDQFEKDWRDILNEQQDWRKCNDAQFLAVARWLYAYADTPPAQLARQLAGLGTPDQALREAITETEYGARSKENKLETDKKAGIELIRHWLTELSKSDLYDKANWPTGIKLLAERVADAVEKKGAVE